MRFGIHLPQAGRHADPQGVLRVARAAEDAGYTSLWLFDHLFTPVDLRTTYPFTSDGKYPLAPEDPYLDPIAVMGALAATTSKVEFGVRVLVAALRPPVVLAKQLASIDAIAGGRVVLGVGAGWMAEEFASVGLPFDGRFERLEEHVEVMRGIWQEGVTGHAGKRYEHVEAGFHPRPPRGTIPIIIGGHSDAALRRVARMGDGWAAMVTNDDTKDKPHAAASPDALADRLAVLRQACDEIGRDYSELRIIANASPADDPGILQGYAELGIHDCDLVIWGGADRIIRDLSSFAEAVGVEIAG